MVWTDLRDLSPAASLHQRERAAEEDSIWEPCSECPLLASGGDDLAGVLAASPPPLF